MELKSLKNLETLIARSLSLPRRYTSAMRQSVRDNPRKALRYHVYNDSLVAAMSKAYALGYREDGSRLPNQIKSERQAEYKRKARQILMQYQKYANQELKTAYDKAIKAGKTPRQATQATLRRFRTLGMTAPATNRIETLFTTAADGAYAQGVWDASQNNQAIKGYRYATMEDDRVRVPVHSQYNRFSAPKTDAIWETAFPPIDYNCRCKAIPLKRVPKGGWVDPPANPYPVTSGFENTGFELR